MACILVFGLDFEVFGSDSLGFRVLGHGNLVFDSTVYFVSKICISWIFYSRRTKSLFLTKYCVYIMKSLVLYYKRC